MILSRAYLDALQAEFPVNPIQFSNYPPLDI